MKSYFRLVFLAPTLFLVTGCGPKTCYVTINANNCIIEGLDKSYECNTRVNAKIKVDDLIYHLPTQEMVLANGVESFTYNENTGDISFIIKSNANIFASAESFLGLESNYSSIALFYGQRMSYTDTQYVPWIKARFFWDFSSVTDPSDQAILFEKMKIYGLDTNELSGEQTLTQTINMNELKTVPILSCSDFLATYPYYPENHYFETQTVIATDYVQRFHIYQTKFPLFMDNGTSNTVITYSVPYVDASELYASNINSRLENYDIGGEHLINGSFAVEYCL